MSQTAPANPLTEDLTIFAEELDATLTAPHFVAWLRKNRPQLDRMNDPDLEVLAAECLMRFAHVPPDGAA